MQRSLVQTINILINFNAKHGMRANVFGWAVAEHEGVTNYVYLEGGRTNNFFAPLGMKPGEEPDLTIPGKL